MDAHNRTDVISLPIDARMKTQFCPQQILQLSRDPLSKPAPQRDSASTRTSCWLMFLMLVAFLTGAGATARAQSTFGSIRGTVQDVQGAVVPGATIVANSLDDNSERQTTSNDAGEFLFENLRAGHYKLTARHDGFTDSVVPAAALEARQELRVPITLSVATETTTVEVMAGETQINTENGTVANTMSNEDVTQLPMNSRAVCEHGDAARNRQLANAHDESQCRPVEHRSG
jgi:hypothetical protein